MTREYDARSRPNSTEFTENYDKVFGKAKAERAERSAKRAEEPDDRPRCTCPKYPFEHTKRSTCPK